MVKLKKILLPVFILAVGIVYWFYTSASEEQLVMRRLHALSSYIDKNPGEKNTQAFVKAESIGSLLEPKCNFGTHYPMLSGTLRSDEVSSLALRGRAMFDRIRVSFRDLKVTFTDVNVAEVNFTVVASASKEDKSIIDDYMEAFCVLRKIDGKWLFSEFRTVQTLEK